MKDLGVQGELGWGADPLHLGSKWPSQIPFIKTRHVANQDINGTHLFLTIKKTFISETKRVFLHLPTLHCPRFSNRIHRVDMVTSASFCHHLPPHV